MIIYQESMCICLKLLVLLTKAVCELSNAEYGFVNSCKWSFQIFFKCAYKYAQNANMQKRRKKFPLKGFVSNFFLPTI